MKLKAGSHSRLVVFEQCRLRAKIQYIDKVPEPDRPLPPGKTEHANDRGTRLHEAAEMYTKGGVEMAPEIAKHFRAEHERLRDLYAEGLVSTEGDWAYTRQWESVAWMSSDVWFRIKCDAVAFMTPTSAVVVDFKSGKRFGNEIKHNEQMQLYVIGTLLRFPKVKTVTTELWYWDQNELATITYTREQGLKLVRNFERRISALTDCEDFPPNPNRFSCKWCPYKPAHLGGTGHCSVGV